MKYTIEIEQDIDVESPRDWDNLGTMVCNHRDYNLGDEQVKDWDYWVAGMLVELGFERPTEQWDDFIYDVEMGDKESVEKALNMISQKIVMLPLYLYDHSGLTMRTSPFSCQWDSGQVGWIYVKNEDAKKEFGWTRLSKSRREKIERILKSEVEVYSQYLEGDVWGFAIRDENGEHVDSCWGFYGYDECEKEAKSVVKYLKEN